MCAHANDVRTRVAGAGENLQAGISYPHLGARQDTLPAQLRDQAGKVVVSLRGTDTQVVLG